MKCLAWRPTKNTLWNVRCWMFTAMWTLKSYLNRDIYWSFACEKCRHCWNGWCTFGAQVCVNICIEITVCRLLYNILRHRCSASFDLPRKERVFGFHFSQPAPHPSPRLPLRLAFFSAVKVPLKFHWNRFNDGMWFWFMVKYLTKMPTT